MPGTLSGLYHPDLVEYTATLGSESVTVKFNRARMNMKRELHLKRAIDEGKTEELVKEIVHLFVSWDVVDDEGNPVPLTEDLLMDLPSSVVVSLFEAMDEAAGPTSEEGNASRPSSGEPPSATSAPASQISPNGTDTAPSPTSSASPSMP